MRSGPFLRRTHLRRWNFELLGIPSYLSIAEVARSGHDGKATLTDLSLLAGTHYVQLLLSISATERVGFVHTLHISEVGQRLAGSEAEPNDRLKYAAGTQDNNHIRGSFDSRDDVDFYRFVIDSKPQLWRVLAVGDNIAKIEVLDANGAQNQRIEAARGQRHVSLEHLFLLPGNHYLSGYR